MLKNWHWTFGGVDFEEGEEYLRFRFRFLYALLLCGAGFSILFFLTAANGVIYFDPLYIASNQSYILLCILLLFLLHGHKSRLIPVAWVFAIASFLFYITALFLVPNDELRIIWFCLNLPAVYIIAGQLAGIAMTVISIICIVAANPYIPAPYSANAITTIIIGISYTSVFFHVYASRSISFFHAMVESNQKLTILAARDPLTNLLNARAYYTLCDRLIRPAQRSGTPFSVLFVDLDHFKSINDRYGHEAGDTVLKEVSLCLSNNSRNSDVVGRIGGEEFSIFLPDTDVRGAISLAEKIRTDIEALMPSIGETKLRVTASIGVAENLPDHLCISDIQREADQAMYKAKEQGRNRVTCLAQLPA